MVTSLSSISCPSVVSISLHVEGDDVEGDDQDGVTKVQTWKWELLSMSQQQFTSLQAVDLMLSVEAEDVQACCPSNRNEFIRMSTC